MGSDGPHFSEFRGQDLAVERLHHIVVGSGLQGLGDAIRVGLYGAEQDLGRLVTPLGAQADMNGAKAAMAAAPLRASRRFILVI